VDVSDLDRSTLKVRLGTYICEVMGYYDSGPREFLFGIRQRGRIDVDQRQMPVITATLPS
jgi:hypothetical protein